jgi:hypothetical protein
LDILIRPTANNARLATQLLDRSGLAQSGFKETRFHGGGQIIQLGRVPSRIALLTSITGLEIDEAFAEKIRAILDHIPVFVLGRQALIKNKWTVGRPQDLADLVTLEA